MIGDVLLLVGASASALAYRTITQSDHDRYIDHRLYILATAAAALALVASFARSGAYDALRMLPPTEVLKTTVRRLLEVMFLLTGCFFILKVSDSFSRFWLVSWGLASMVGLCAIRLIFSHIGRRLIRLRRLTKNLAIVGANEVGQRLAAQLAQDGFGTRLVGVFDQRRSRVIDTVRVCEMQVLDDLLDNEQVDEIVITIPAAAAARIAELLRRFHPFSVSLRVLTPAGFQELRVLDSFRYGEIGTFGVMKKPLDEVAVVVKWVEDKVIALLCLLFALPLMLPIAAAIKLESRGPVLFRQKRLGANNRPFNLLKFRSMYNDQTDPLGRRLTCAGDPRVTLVGRVLRSTSLDELPQLINVLCGDMSLVGPRPHALEAHAGGVSYVNAVNDYPIRHRVKPGMTGWAQVNGWRGETTRIEQIRGRLECDLYYVDNWSLTFDLLILGRTLFAVLSRANAV